jgi:prepilin-type N-terminal cleavage/methylation domain-containing protein
MSPPRRRASIAAVSDYRGFTLAELAIVLLIVGLLLAGFLTPISTQLDLQRIGQTQKMLDEAKEALIGYAASQSPTHLPCPDKTTAAGAGTANDGQEDFDPVTGVCTNQEGNIPWATLGVAPADPWGNRLHYRVTAAFSNRSPFTPTLSLASAGDIRVCASAGCAAAVAIANNVPVVVLSYGKNGYGAISAAGGGNPPAPAGNTDEVENTNQDITFVSRSKTAIGTGAGEFDDIVSWISTGVLFNRLIAAQKLP